MGGNKVDAAESRQVTANQVRNYSSKKVLPYYDVSVRDKHNFERPFLWLLRVLTNQPQMEFVGQFAEAPSQPSAAATQAALRSHEHKLREASSKTVESMTRL